MLVATRLKSAREISAYELCKLFSCWAGEYFHRSGRMGEQLLWGVKNGDIAAVKEIVEKVQL